MIGKLTPFSWNPMTLSWLKPMPMGRRKVKDQWKEDPYKVEFQVAEGIPSYLMKNQWTGHS